jgi:ABC-type ATPase with predicted acetyltransferase domain
MTSPQDDSWTATRLAGIPNFPLLREMIFEEGTREDWEALHELHYKAVGRTGGRYYRVSLRGELVGVCIMTQPRGLLRDRHELFPHLKPGRGDTKYTNTYRYKWLNANISLNSRTVVDTMYRGIGVAYRLLNLAGRSEGRKIVEIQSSMSRFNTFAQKAGFVFAKSKEHPAYQDGVTFFALTFKADPVDFIAVSQEYHAMSEAMQRVTLKRMRSFYWDHSAMEKTKPNGAKEISRVNDMEFAEVLRNLQQLVFASPMYGVYLNPDAGRTDIPKTMPLMAFDCQKPSEKLNLERVKTLC